ncbi:RagB/SusD family nutrient uptake outer membrane protein [Sphingobacterium phlebotomi]|uniref:RagB/SusD family nutrient uptake outer membrane protein n=1 Tax=Sphingobacterium phlebotomi TaxID=2605433 RepID=A0A5D4H5R4_9SPHI|nr:RagB/SusD family nutrient uptake outer membrane protein [Sphingobacterium phlebotomi]TYR35369.1 RagB/SusD family nutrient uptake outer membrane protein [Sphingobacterium phlebotomi]
MKKTIYAWCVGALALSGCAKFLEEDNRGGITNEEFYRTEAGYTSIMNTSYATLRTTFGVEAPWVLLGGTDIYQMNREQANRALMEYTQLFADNGDVLTFYTNCYQAIQNINVAIFYNDIAEVSEEQRQTWLAELRFLRAFYHFTLIEQFGAIVINDEPTLEGPRLSLPRTSLAESFDFVIREMEAALPNLGDNRARVNKATANHYLAKAYLTRAWDLNQRVDFTKAQEYAEAAIDGYTISIPYEQLWSPTNEMNDEVLFAVQYDGGSIGDVSEGNNQQGLFGPYLGGAELNHKYMTSALIPAWNLHNFYEENDARYDATFMLTIYDQYFDYYDGNKDKTEIPIRAYYPRVWEREYTRADSLAWVQGKEDQIASNFRYYPFKYDEQAYRAAYQIDMSTPVIKKFDSPSTRQIFNTHASVRDIVLARKAETFFLYAEASIGLNDFPTAEQFVQKVLDRPGNAKDGGTLTLSESIANASSQSEALDGLLIESAKEFAGEYLRWAELRRTGKLKELCGRYNYDIRRVGVDQAFRGQDGQDKIYRPIPQAAIDINEAEIPQNPGYN